MMPRSRHKPFLRRRLRTESPRSRCASCGGIGSFYANKDIAATARMAYADTVLAAPQGKETA